MKRTEDPMFWALLSAVFAVVSCLFAILSIVLRALA